MEDFDSKWLPVHNSFTYYLQVGQNFLGTSKWYQKMHENCKFFIVSLMVVYILTAQFAVLVALEFALLGNYFNIFKGFSTMTPDSISKKDFIHCDNKRVKPTGFRNISGVRIKFNCPLLILQPSLEFFMIRKLLWGRLFLEN